MWAIKLDTQLKWTNPEKEQTWDTGKKKLSNPNSPIITSKETELLI